VTRNDDGDTRTIALGLPSSRQRRQIAATSASKYEPGGVSSPVNWAAVIASPALPQFAAEFIRGLTTDRQACRRIKRGDRLLPPHAWRLRKACASCIRDFRPSAN
jgi:hypothetical protein